MLSTAVLKLDHPFGSSLFRVIAALHKVFQCYSFTMPTLFQDVSDNVHFRQHNQLQETFGLVVAGLEPAAMGGAHLALPSSELHDHINCFRAGETHAQLRSECGSYIVRARSLTKLTTSTPDQECDCLANPVANFIDNIILVRIHVDFSTLADNLFMEDFDQIQLSNQLAHWWFRPELNRRTRSFNPLLYRLSYRTTKRS